MSEPTAAEEDSPECATRQVPTRVDALGRPCSFVEVEEDLAGQWDARVWSRDLPR